MKASQFSDAQKAFILRQGADGIPVAAICRKAGISQAIYFNWKKKYEGLQPPEMQRLKQLEDENSKLKKMVADLSLDREMLQDVSYQAEDVVATPERACATMGYPKTIRVDQGTEFVSRDRSLGLRERRHPGLLTPRKTDRQRLH
jgi:putative transposase